MRPGRGFTLTELLVGVAIGLIGIIAMFHVLSTWDKTKRTTAAGSDAQIAGAVGLFPPGARCQAGEAWVLARPRVR
jgi:prepilin-type N-terminal cleavage/methylation domain-containing protein